MMKVDVDIATDVKEACGINCMPTFQVYKGGQMVDKLEGASEEGLVAMLDRAVE